MTNLYDQSFWDDESESLREDLAEVIIGALMAGVAGGTSLLPANARVLVDFDRNKNTPKGALSPFFLRDGNTLKDIALLDRLLSCTRRTAKLSSQAIKNIISRLLIYQSWLISSRSESSGTSSTSIHSPQVVQWAENVYSTGS